MQYAIFESGLNYVLQHFRNLYSQKEIRYRNGISYRLTLFYKTLVNPAELLTVRPSSIQFTIL